MSAVPRLPLRLLLRVLAVFSALVLVLEAGPDAPNVVYVLQGSEIKLRPADPPPLRSVVWKRGGDLLAEWDNEDGQFTFYPSVKDRAKLDQLSGELRVSAALDRDSGLYSVELNSKLHPPDYPVQVLRPVPVPEVAVQPLSCSSTSRSCNLTCHADTQGAGPVSYLWKLDEAEWEESGMVRAIEPEEAKTYTCRIQNPVSKNDSAPIQDPFSLVGPKGGVGGAVAVGVIGVLVLVAIGGLLFWGLGTNSGRQRLTNWGLLKSNTVEDPENPRYNKVNSEPPVDLKVDSEPPVDLKVNSEPPADLNGVSEGPKDPQTAGGQ